MVLKILKEKISKIDIINVKGGITASQVYKKYKPDYFINLTLYDMATGTNITHLKDEGVASGYLFSDEGIGIKGDNEMLFCTKNDKSVRDFVGGSPILLKNGEKCIDWGNKYSEYVDGCHIRSAIGFNDKEVALFVSDEKMTLNELIENMKLVRCQYAINLDGGGSSHLQMGSAAYKKSTRKNASWLLIYLKKDYGGIPKVEDIKIKQMLLTPSKYTRPQTKIKPTAIAWHYVANPNSTAVANRNYFESLKDSHKTKASSHYIIGLAGEIIQCIPDLEKSFCTNDANDYTISVECCHPDETGKFTEATYKSMVWLGRYLMQKHSIKNNIRHYDVTGKICPKWFVDNPDEWEKFKDDLEVEEMPRYKTVEEMPEYYRKDIQELIDRGIIAGRGGEAGLDLSDDMCRMAIYAKKIFEIGAK